MIGVIAAIAKLPAMAKAAMVGAFLLSGAIVTGVPINDIWFDYVLFIVFSALVGGMPAPDEDLHGWKFWHAWIYRSSHLLVASATAYFLHQKKWGEISGDKAHAES